MIFVYSRKIMLYRAFIFFGYYVYIFSKIRWMHIIYKLQVQLWMMNNFVDNMLLTLYKRLFWSLKLYKSPVKWLWISKIIHINQFFLENMVLWNFVWHLVLNYENRIFFKTLHSISLIVGKMLLKNKAFL